MIGSTNRKRMATPKGAARRKALSEPDIATSGGCHIVHFKHFLGVGSQVFFVIDILPITEDERYRVEIFPIGLELDHQPANQIQPFFTTKSTRQEAHDHGRTTYDQAVIEARDCAEGWFKCHLAELAAHQWKTMLASPNFKRPDFRFEVVEAQDWQKKLLEFQRVGQINDQWIEMAAGKTQSGTLRKALCDLKKLDPA
jgi:hypothetical protein